MKEGTLLRGTGPTKDWGVVYKNDGEKIHIYWHKAEITERLSAENFNKWIIGGFMEVIEIKEKTNEQEPSQQTSEEESSFKAEEKAEKY
tara:strand:+ start:459 stop:725 length:267 start_codon:yes stop_codon:yes gene_type:complete